jgi:methyl-accepting chemotaxis protein
MFKNLKLMRKYQSILLFLGLFFVVFMLLITRQINVVKNEIETLNQEDIKVQELKDIQKLYLQGDSLVSEYISLATPETIGEYAAVIEMIKAGVSELSNTTDDQEEQEAYVSILQQTDELTVLFEEEIVYGTDRGLRSHFVIGKNNYIDINKNILASFDAIIDQYNQSKTVANTNLSNSLQMTQVVFLILLIVVGVLSFLLVYLLTRNISKRLKQLVDTNNEINKKNLKVNKVREDYKDEIGLLAISSNAMVDTLNDIIREMRSVAVDLEEQGQNVKGSANEAKHESGYIHSTMDELSLAMNNQADVLNHIVENINTLKDEIVNTNNESRKLSKASESLSDLSTTGNELMDDSIISMKKIDSVVNNAVNMMKQLEVHANGITSLTDVINNISAQTNLLSLNASIEAARAGEAGKGFGVVAGEIGTLATQVNKSALDIDDIIKKVQSETKKVTAALADGYKEVENGMVQINQSADTFVRIHEEAVRVEKRAVAIDNNLDEIETNSTKVAEAIDQISAIAEETSASIEQTLSGVKGQDELLGKILDESQKMHQISGKLNANIHDFQV